jgi:hypothetical protein
MGSKKAPPPPQEQLDLAKAQTDATYRQMALTEDYYNWARQQAALENERGLEQWNYLKGLSTEANDRSRRLDQRYWDTTAKQEDEFYRLVDQYSTPAEADRMAGRGIANVEGQLDSARGAYTRGLTARGWNPNSAAMQSSLADIELEGALAKASAATMAYEAAKREGLNLRATAAGLGGNLMGASGNYLGQSGDLSGSALAAGGTGFRAGNQAWAGQNTGQATAMNWGSSAAKNWDSIAEQNYRRSQSGGLGGLGSALGGIAGSFFGPMGSVVGANLGGAISGGLGISSPSNRQLESIWR